MHIVLDDTCPWHEVRNCASRLKGLPHRMPIELTGQNVVIVAQQFNPSVISQLWLSQYGIVPHGDFRPGCVFADSISNVVTSEFTLLVLPHQLQLVPTGQNPGQIVNEKVGTILNLLPHTPYKAIGLNFTWHVTGEDVCALTRRLFFRDDKVLFHEFDASDAQFGAYLSKNFLGMRLKLDIKPITLDMAGQKESRLQFAFNFNRDATAVNDLSATLTRWNEAAKYSEHVAKKSLE